MVEDADCVDPSTIVYAKKKNTNASNYDYNLIAQSVSLLDITTGTYPGTIVELEFKDRYITIDKLSGSGATTLYSAKIELKSSTYVIFVGYPNLGIRYFMDDAEHNFAITEANTSSNAQWYIEPVTGLHVNPPVEYKGKYYTTMYTPFAYTLSGDVLNAYVITAINEDGSLTKLSIAQTGGTVPAGTPVILECASNTVADNIIVPTGAPLTDSSTNYTGTNLLKGAYICNQDGKMEFTTSSGKSSFNADNYTKYDNSAMRVLGLGTSSGRLGFFENSNTVMKSNKVWLDISSTTSANTAFSIEFDDTAEKGGNDEEI